MPRYSDIGRFIRNRRAELGIESARALALKAGLSHSHVGVFERGEFKPRRATAEKLAKALELEGPALARFRKLLATAGASDAEVAAITTPISGLVLFRFLPEAIFAVPHRDLALWQQHQTDDMLADSVRGLAGLLAWIGLDRHPPTGRAAANLRERTLEVFRASEIDATSRRLRESGLPWTPASAAASALPSLWQAALFDGRRNTQRAVEPLSGWSYQPHWYPGAQRLSASLKGGALNDRLAFDNSLVPLVRQVHGAMIAVRLWAHLNLNRELGDAPSEQAMMLDFAGALRRLRAYSPADIESRLATRGGLEGRIFEDVEQLSFALRLYEVPDLAHEVLEGTPRDELANLVAAADAAIERAIDRLDTAPVRPTTGQPGSEL